MNQPLPVSDAQRLLEQLLSSSSDIHEILSAQQLKLLQEATESHRTDWAAHMTPNLAPYSQLGMQLASMHQGNLLSAELYPQLKHAEISTLAWLKNCFGFPYAHFTHGGSYNNLQALWQARNTHDASRRRVYASKACHYSVIKACDILGLELALIDTDENDKIRPDKLKQACLKQPPLAIVLTAGTSALGAIDPLKEAAELANEYKSWLHIDASWGGAVMILPENFALLEWAQQADSLCFDPHKSLFQPRPCSVFMSRHAAGQLEQTDYLTTAPVQHLPGSYGGELFLPLWLNLQLLGQEWFFNQTRVRLKQAQRFSCELEQLGFAVKNGDTGIVCFSKPDKSADALIDNGMFSKAQVNQRAVYRAVFASSRTQADSLIRALHPYL